MSQDRDSTISNASSSQADLGDTFYQVEEDGRQYLFNSDFKTSHPLPSDEREEGRLLVQFLLCFQALGGRLILAPIRATPQRVLDVGTGFGCWAIRLADRYPSAAVIGTDLVPIPPSLVPINCEFQIDDAESPWNFTTLFDLIHFGYADTWVRDWPKIARQTFEALEPGGWIELKANLPWEYNESTRHHTTIVQYHRDLFMGAREWGITLHQGGTFYQQLLNDAGFVNFQEQKFYLDSAETRILYQKEGLDTFGKGYICRGLGKDTAELQVQLTTIRAALQDSTLEIRFPVSICYAQKPFGGTRDNFSAV
jgi:SAM-dependent methyltransferase